MKEEIKEAHVFSHGLEFPVIVYVKDEKQKTQVWFFEEIFPYEGCTVEDVCLWCAAHGIAYRVFISDSEKKNPFMRIRYNRIMRRLGKRKFQTFF